MPDTSDNLKKILICGDSFGLIDPDFPGLHFSEKILSSTPPVFEIHNLCHGGASNALIVLQLLQGLRFDPNFVIILFTTTHRHEVDNDQTVYYPRDINLESIRNYDFTRYQTTLWITDKDQIKLNNDWNTKILSSDFEVIKNYFLIDYCLQSLKYRNIPFCYSIGGMQNCNMDSIIDKNFFDNHMIDYYNEKLKINLWNHSNGKDRPYFHVDNESVQTSFTNECLHHLKKAGIID